MSDDELAARCRELEARLAKMTKVNEVLMRRVERGMDLQDGAFSLFQAATALETQVRARTAALQDAMRTLEQANRDLRLAKQTADHANRAKSEFLAKVSHEIRTPMNGVLGMTELLLASEMPAHQRQLVETVHRSAHSLLGIINGILDFSKIEAGKLELESIEFDPRDTIDETCEMLAEHAHQKSLLFVSRVAHEVPARVVGDPGRLRQILTNLIGNAIKFTSAGSVTVEVTASDRASGAPVTLRFDVVDTGIGIPAAAQARIFEAFSQADGSTTRKHGGTGLGLSIARQLASMMGGTIEVARSEVDRGTTFSCTVRLAARADGPRAPAPPRVRVMGEGPERRARRAALEAEGPAVSRAPASRRAEAPPRLGARVLLAEDNPINRAVAVGMLDVLGCEVVTVEDGVAACAALQRGSFDVVLMDCEMPSMDGLAATRAIRRAEGALAHVPIVALTANAMDDDRRRCLIAGMDDFLSKPFSIAQLAETLGWWRRRGGGVDMTRILELRAIDPTSTGFVNELISMFLARTPEALTQMLQALERRDLAAVRQLAHGLRSTSATMGVVALAEACERIQHSAEVDGDGIAADVCACPRHFALAFSTLRDAMQTGAPPSARPEALSISS